MNSFGYAVAAAVTSGILLVTDNIPSSQLASKWANHADDFFCKAGTGPEDEAFRLAAENFPVIILASLTLIFVTVKFIRLLPVKALCFTAIIYALTLAIVGFMRYSTQDWVKNVCHTLAARSQSALLTQPKDLITPFLHPLQYLPERPFTNDVAERTYAHIYPHLGEYFVTLEPVLPYAYLALGLMLEFRPIRTRFWHYLPYIGAIVSFPIMVMAHRSEFQFVEPYDMLLNTILQYAVFYIATFALLAMLVVLFRLGMRRISIVGLFLLVSRLHVLGMPQLEFYFEMLLIIFLISFLVTACEFSPGAFALYALGAHYMNWQSIEWGLVVMLLDNALHRILAAMSSGRERQYRNVNKTKRD